MRCKINPWSSITGRTISIFDNYGDVLCVLAVQPMKSLTGDYPVNNHRNSYAVAEEIADAINAANATKVFDEAK